MDIGGHRFFSKSDRVMNWWKDILPIQGAPSRDDILLGRDVPLSNLPAIATCLQTKPFVARRHAFRVYVLNSFHPRRTAFWWALFALGLAFRVYAVLVLRNPMDALFSDPWRHWENAKLFLTPTAMGASNPYLYQLYLFLVQKATHENKLAFGLATGGLSIAYAVVWLAFALSVFRTRLNALRFATILCWLPSHVSIFGFCMNETLLLPLLGLALWLTKRSLVQRTPGSFVAMTTAWTLALLTRSVVGPIGLGCVLVSWLRLRRRRWLALGVACAISFVWLAAASIRAHKILNRYTPFGDNSIATVYFVSAAHDYSVDIKGYGKYFFSSPSLYVSPFKPFAEFESIRIGAVSFSLDPALKGKDVQQTPIEQFEGNWKKLPRLFYENFIFLAFGHSWPTAGATNDRGDAICLAQRWMWAPLTLLSLVGSILYISRRGAAFVPIVTIGFVFTFYVLAQVAFLEGRYRMPMEPMMLLAPIWLWDVRRRA